MNFNEIDAIIFDLGGVILNLDYDETIKTFQSLINLDVSTFYGSRNQLEFFSNYEIGKIDTIQFIEKFNQHYCTHFSKKEFENIWNLMIFDIPPERIEFLKKLSLKTKIFLLSNINEIHHERVSAVVDETFPNLIFDNIFHKVYYSHLVGLRKPSEKVFQLILSENNLAADKTLFIDDSIQHIEGAKQLGLKVHHLSKEQSILELNVN